MNSLVFLTGCGGSGTTILGRLLGRHPRVTYLNDRFDLWVDALPIADIWGFSDRDDHGARVELTANDLDRPGVRDGIDLVRSRLEAQRAGSPVLIEKLAINNFRLAFLHAAFPDAAFINITRHGLEVAACIARKVELGRWYGRNDRKWALLRDYAGRIGLGELAESCQTPFEKGLLEWRLSVESAADFFDRTHDARAAHVRYEHLVDDSAAVAGTLFRFLDLDHDPAVSAWAGDNIARRSPTWHDIDDAPAERIAGCALRRLGYSIAAHAGSQP